MIEFPTGDEILEHLQRVQDWGTDGWRTPVEVAAYFGTDFSVIRVPLDQLKDDGLVEHRFVEFGPSLFRAVVKNN